MTSSSMFRLIGRLIATALMAFPTSAHAQDGDLAGIVAGFYPMELELLANQAGRPLKREQCFGILERDATGNPRTLVAGYTNLISAAVRVLVSTGGEFQLAAESQGEDLAGWLCKVHTADIDRDGRLEAHVQFAANNATTDWFYAWDGVTLTKLTPTSPDPVAGVAVSDVVNARLVDVDGDGRLEIYSFDQVRNDEIPAPARLYRLIGSSFVLDRPTVASYEFTRSDGTPRTDLAIVLVPSGAQGPFRFRVYNGTGAGARVESSVESGRIWLNGQEIVRPNDFGNDVALIERSVTLEQQNRLEVRLGGAPGGRITIVVDPASWAP